MKLNYEQIRTDGGTQPRSQLLIEVMEDYAEQMRAGVEFPPIYAASTELFPLPDECSAPSAA